MVETNPFKIEEAKWTPKNVYEILPPNAISYTGYDYSEGSTDFDQEKTRSSLLDGFFDFFGDLLGGIGAIIGGAVNIGGAILSPIINGIGNLIGGIANAIGSIFGGGPSTSPPPPLFNPIKTNLEAAIQPHLDQLEESKKAIEAAQLEQLLIREQIREQSVILDDALERAEKGITDAEAAREVAVEAVGKADAAVVKLEEYNTALREEIRVEFSKANTKAEAAIAEAEATNVKLGEINSEIEAVNNKTAELTTAQANINAELTAINGDIAPLSGRISDLNSELNQKTQALESGLSEANTSIDEAKTLTQQVKAVADKNKTDVASAISKADKANTDLSALSTKVTKNQTDVAKAITDISTANTNITKVQEDATKAFTEAGKVRNEVTPKIEAAQTKGTEALLVADKAVDWLKNPVEIGGSLIAVNPETKRPYYADPLEQVEDFPAGTTGPTYMRPEGRPGLTTHGPKVPVDSRIKYTVSFWAKASKDGSRIYGQLRTQEGRNVAPDGTALAKGAVTVSDPPQPSNKSSDGKYVHAVPSNSYFISNLTLRTEWTYYETEIQFSPGVTAVSISVMYWNHSSGVSANQYISGLDIRPQIPTQAEVDKAQNDAIKANSDILVQQGLINDAQGKINAHAEIFRDNQTKWNTAATNALDALKKFNDNQIKWNEGAAAAIEANTTAIKALNAPQIGSSILPLVPGTTSPTWSYYLRSIPRGGTRDALLPEGITEIFRDPSGSLAAGGTSWVDVPDKNLVAVDSTIEYEASWWTLSSAGSARYIYVTMEDEKGNRDIVKKARDEASSPHNWGSPIRTIITPATTTWTKYTTRFQFKEGTQFVRVADIFFSNSSNTSSSYLYIADLHIGPKIPNQADVDEAQNKAIESHSVLFAQQNGWNATQEKLNKTTADFVKLQTDFNNKQIGWNTLQGQINDSNTTFQNFQRDFNEKQIKWNAASTNATNALQDATTALARIAGISVGGRNLLKESLLKLKTTSYLMARVPLGDSRPETGETVTISLKAVPGAGNTRFRFFNSNGNGSSNIFDLFISETTPTADGVYSVTGTWKNAGGNSHLNIYAYPSSVATETTIEWVKLERGNKATDWSPAPEDLPSQAEVDKLQDEAILKTTEVAGTNTSAIAALQQAVSSVADIVSLDEAYKAQQEEIQGEIIKRQELLESIQALQNEMIARTIVKEGTSTYDDYIDITGSKVTAKSYRGWAGQIVVTSAWRSGNGSSTNPYLYRTQIDRFPVPDGLSREWTISSGFSSMAVNVVIDGLRVDYWVYPGKAVKINATNSGNYISGSSFSSGSWGTLWTRSSFPANNGNTIISWQTELKNADRDTYYELRVLIDGKQEYHRWFKGKGPLWFGGSGIDYLNFVWEYPIPQGARVEIQGRTRASTATQAMVNSNKGTIGYIQPA